MKLTINELLFKPHDCRKQPVCAQLALVETLRVYVEHITIKLFAFLYQNNGGIFSGFSSGC